MRNCFRRETCRFAFRPGLDHELPRRPRRVENEDSVAPGWTIEATIRPDDATNGFQTFVGRVQVVEGRLPADPLFARRERERVRALVKFAKAGFRVVA